MKTLTPTEGCLSSHTGFVVLTGDGEGLGNALLLALLQQSRLCRVIGISRRPVAQVRGYRSLPATSRDRYTHVRADLSVEEGVRDALEQTRGIVKTAGGSISALYLVNGTGFLDTEARARPALLTLMTQLNETAPMMLLAGLLDEPSVVRPEAPVFYFSGVVTHPSIRDPLLTFHADVKRRAAASLRERFGPRLKVVMPGAYRTAMLEHAIARPDALLEWFAVPIADPYARGGLLDWLARQSQKPHPHCPETVIRPRISKLLVELCSAERLRRVLPSAIRRSARTVLHQIGQTDAHHDARVSYMADHRLYGDDFPYQSILSSRLWPSWLSLAQSGAMERAGLLR